MAMNGTGHARLTRSGRAMAWQGQRRRAGRLMRPGHPPRQAVLLPGHGAAGHDHRDSDPGRPGTATGSLGDTGSVMPALTRAGRLNRTALRPLGPGSARLPAGAESAGWAAKDAADHERLTSRRSGVSCCGVQHGGIRYGAAAGRGSRPGKGPATSRQRRTALVAGGTDSGPKGRPGPVPPVPLARLCVKQRLSPAGTPQTADRRPGPAGGVPCYDVHGEVPGGPLGMHEGGNT
jgi:hypothetical protein